MSSHNDTESMSENDFYRGAASIYHRAPDGRVYVIRLDVDVLQDLEDGEIGGDSEGELTDSEAAFLREAVQIAEVGRNVLTAPGVKPLDVGQQRPLVRAWLTAIADAIEEAGGVPSEPVMPPIPASDEMAAAA